MGNRKNKPYDDWETEFIRANYPILKVKEIAEQLHRSADNVSMKISKLGLSMRRIERCHKPAHLSPRWKAKLEQQQQIMRRWNVA